MLFSKYMTNWLYGASGYYANYREIGKNGDFYTAVSSSILFGGSIALEIIKLIDSGKFSNKLTVCEIGAHRGYLIADIIQTIFTFRPDLISSMKFVIIERFDNLRETQKKYLIDSFGDNINLEIFGSLSEFKADEIFFISNEIFDAFPCELIYKNKIASTNQNGKIEFDINDNKIIEIANKYNRDRGEIAVGYESFADEVKNSINIGGKAEFVSFDYGDMQIRPDFSIRIYFQHKTYPLFEENLNLNNLFGKSDITFDVHFEHVRDSFVSAGWNFLDFKTQMKALVEFGIINLLDQILKNSSQRVYNSELNRAKILIDPAFMGERFKMIRFDISK